ncbi:MAG: FecR family protein [Oscillospiraceae bacterium]|nr:FecR family protein [Oscillospiraceae bacterium]MCL2278523.1 FecR family protein [Oscillospiraceae bacterium]
MKTRNKRIITAILIVCLSGGLVIPASAADYAARVISVFRAEGEVSLLRGTARSVTPRRGQRLNVDDTLQTGEDSSVHLRMDRETILLMDQNSRVTVESAGRRLLLSVEEGKSLVHAEPQAAGNTLETRVGNVGLTVRGTMFTMGLLPNNNTSIAMLSGYGDVDDVTLYAGNVMTVDEYGEQTIEELRLEDLDPFTLQAVHDNMDYLLELGSWLTEDMVPMLESLVSELVIIIRPPVAVATPEQATPPEVNPPSPPWDDWTPEPPPPPPVNTPPVEAPPPAETPPSADTTPPDDADSGSSGSGGSGSGSSRPPWWWGWWNRPTTPPVDTAPVTPSKPPNVDGVYQISTVEHLKYLAQNDSFSNNKTFVLVNDEPLVINFMIPNFNGTFNGNGRAIEVRLCNTASNNSIAADAAAVGLFGTVTGKIHDLYLIAYVNTDHNNVGGLAGINTGTIRNVSVLTDGGITGGDNVGGLVGVNNGTIEDVSVSGMPQPDIDGNFPQPDGDGNLAPEAGEIDGTHNVGGAVGVNNGVIRGADVYANVTSACSSPSPDCTGGIYGRNNSTADNVDGTFSGKVNGVPTEILAPSDPGSSVPSDPTDPADPPVISHP